MSFFFERPKQLLAPIALHSMKEKSTMEVNGQQKLFGWENSSKYLLLCSTEQRNSYKFRTTWGWV